MTKPQARILVVDDERNLRKNLSLVLGTAGYTVETASDGNERQSELGKEGTNSLLEHGEGRQV